ncbi:cyclin-dependent kinase-like protein (macronuclear) [Tetrahymena thermophila SB210]|uniref:Cyclin-dependent kinase 2 homolog n=1 Tax=Tetrahymena thermophila (strain SB210) TaxID=312017 RepID=I7M9A4_TETTS|nr:cyclin-dependent kinase-like protein [Tetrahymena thermophila SB210]EAS01207.2 cyclin-dependent kinase-like protein [Tetrahymena thermophila SB210]|eukprot:XP_001021452.2 cyclin-dependent kinase-like protein [Tetrahymena thermophila SB210]
MQMDNQEQNQVEKFIGKYEVLNVIGKGTYGEVFRARDQETHEIVALKKTITKLENDGIPSSALREISLLKEINHENVVVLKDIIIQNNLLYLVFEFCESDLKKFLDSKTKVAGQFLDALTIKKIVYQIIRGVAACHTRRIMHRDLKPQNILIDKNEVVKIADFGLSRTFCMPIRPYTKEVVTLWYRPPEILLGALDYCTPIDMWSVGCIMYELITRVPLFQGDCEIGQIFKIFQILGTPTENDWPGIKDLTDYKPTFPRFRPQKLSEMIENIYKKYNQNSEVDIAAVDLLQRLLCYDPIKRITAKSALNHPYFFDVRNLFGPI